MAKSSKRVTPASSMEAQENKMIAMAVNLAAKQLEEGTASSQVITHYLKLGTTKEKLEKEKLEAENTLLRAKAEALASTKHIEELYNNAIKAMRSYTGNDIEEDEYED